MRQRLIRSSRVIGGNVEYDYAANGNLLRKTDYSADMANAYTYGLGVSQGNGECGPHAASRITLPGNGLDTYHCDGNGNIVGGNTVNLRFAADNRAVYSTRLSTTLNATPSFCESTTPLDRIFCDGFEARPSIPSGTTLWAYAPDGFRYYKATSQGVTYFDRAGYERTGAVERHELGPVIVERRNGVDTITAVLTDRLGSTIATIDTATETRAYDAFGQVRNRDLTNKLNGTLDLPRSIRGFTQHEHADDVRLIHMKGRLYDYKLGRFLSVDPIVQFPANSQSLNPYSYIMNNPLAGTDPTGFASCTVGKGQSCTALNRDSRSANKLGNTRFVQGEDGQVHAQGSLGGTAQITGKDGVLTAMLGPSTGGNGAQIQSSAGAGSAKDQKASPDAKGAVANYAGSNSGLANQTALRNESAGDSDDIEVDLSAVPSDKIRAQMTSDNPHDRTSAAYAAIDHFKIKGISNYQIQYQPDLPFYGLVGPNRIVYIGPKTFKSWSMLGSTLGHEIEVHITQFIFLGAWKTPRESYRREVEAHKYNLKNASRFKNTPSEIRHYQRSVNTYENAFKTSP